MLVRGTVAFLTGLIIGSFLPYFPLTAMVLLLGAAVAHSWSDYRRRVAAAPGLILFGNLLLGLLYWTGFLNLAASDTPLAQFTGTVPIRMVGTIVEPVRHAPDRAILVLALSEIGDRGTPAKGRVRVTWRSPDLPLHQGDVIAVVAKTRRPSGVVNPGGFDYEAYLERQGIGAIASVAGPGRITLQEPDGLSARWSLVQFVDHWRERIREGAVATLQGPALGLYLGMIIGEPDYLSPDVRDLFMATGTVHILSISGSHLGLIAWLSFFLIRRLCRHLPARWLLALSRRVTPTRLAVLLTILPVTFYTFLAGAHVATVRSLIMILLFLLAVWLGRDNSLLPALAIAALLVLGFDPRAIFDISFQLSYLSVLTIALVVRWRYRVTPHAPASGAIRQVWRWLQDSLWITVGVTLVTLPLVAYYFNQVAWLGLVANFLIVPLAGFVLVPLGLASAVWLLISGAQTLPAAFLNQSVGDLFVQLVSLLARIPGAEWHVASPLIPAIAAFYLLLYVAGCPGMVRSARIGAALGVTGLLVWWAWSPRWMDGETVRVTFLDVGQGDACLIELPDRRAALIDGGAAYETFDMGRSVVGPYLWDQGIRRLDYVIGTHPQLDHVGGLAWIVRKFAVGEYWGNGLRRDEAFYHRLQESLLSRGLTERNAVEGRVIVDTGPCKLRVVNPPAADQVTQVRAVNTGSLLNNLSVVTRLDCGPHSFLFTADIETDAIARLRDDTLHGVRMLKVPHHGARSSLDTDWIGRIQADTAVISVGRANGYGHPAAAVLQAYERAGIPVWRTDRQGAIQITARMSSPAVDVRTGRGLLLQPVALGSTMLGTERDNLSRLWRQWVGRGA